MRIINLLPHSQHYSYGSSADGGRTLKAGESSPELLLKTVHNPQFIKDIQSKKIQLRLNELDMELLEQLTEWANEPVKKVKEATKPKKKEKAVKPPKAVQSANAPCKHAPPMPERKTPLGQPDFGQEAEVIDEKRAGEVDLAALQGHNRLAEAKKIQTPSNLSEIKEFMGSRV